MESFSVKEVEADVKKYKSIEAILNQDGGKLLIENLKTDIASDIDTIISLFKAPEMELRCAVAKLIADLSLYRVLLHAPKNAKLAQEVFESLLKEKEDV